MQLGLESLIKQREGLENKFSHILIQKYFHMAFSVS